MAAVLLGNALRTRSESIKRLVFCFNGKKDMRRELLTILHSNVWETAWLFSERLLSYSP